MLLVIFSLVNNTNMEFIKANVLEMLRFMIIKFVGFGVMCHKIVIKYQIIFLYSKTNETE